LIVLASRLLSGREWECRLTLVLHITHVIGVVMYVPEWGVLRSWRCVIKRTHTWRRIYI